MIELIIDASSFEIPDSRTKIDFVRIKCLIGFREKDGTGYRLTEGIIDTGAYVTVMPKGLSERIDKQITGSYKMKGLNSRDECAIPVAVGKTKCVLFDRLSNVSEELEIACYFAHSDAVPVIIGFADILTRFKISVDYPHKKAFLI